MTLHNCVEEDENCNRFYPDPLANISGIDGHVARWPAVGNQLRTEFRTDWATTYKGFMAIVYLWQTATTTTSQTTHPTTHRHSSTRPNTTHHWTTQPRTTPTYPWTTSRDPRPSTPVPTPIRSQCYDQYTLADCTLRSQWVYNRNCRTLPADMRRGLP